MITCTTARWCAAPNLGASVQNITAASNSYKFYIPQIPSNDTKYNNLSRETELAQELFTIGYYIVTVDGPRVNVDFFSSTTGFDFADVDLVNSPANTVFYKRESWGYSLNGKEFVIAQGASYDVVKDSFAGTDAAILAGQNGSTAVDRSQRQMVKTVNTGWSSRSADDDGAASEVLTLWGTADSLALWDDTLTGLLPESSRTKKGDAIALSMSCDKTRVRPNGLGNGSFGIAARDSKGNWVNAVDLNEGGSSDFVVGPYREAYGLGTYGVDPPLGRGSLGTPIDLWVHYLIMSDETL